MEPNEFVKKFGIEFAKKWFVKNVGDTPTHQKYVNIVNGEPKGIISTASYGGFHVAELKRLIESHGLADRLGGVDTMRIMIEQMEINDFCGGMNISFDGEWQGVFTKDQLQQAICDVEACQ